MNALKIINRIKAGNLLSGTVCGLCNAPHSATGPSRSFSLSSNLRLNEFQKKKIMGEFSVLYDRNQDGFVDREDVDDYRKCLFDYYAITRGENMKTYPTYFNDYWSLFRDIADENHDGKLSEEEWLKVWTKITDKATNKTFKELPQWVQLMPHVIFPLMDYKHDGLIDSEEYKRFWYEVGGIRCTSSQANDCMKTMTENGDSPLNMKRFQALYADFYFSATSDSPGRYMAGPVDYT